jgi:hypothetical protein
VQNVFPADTITTLIVRNNPANTVDLYTIGMIFLIASTGKSFAGLGQSSLLLWVQGCGKAKKGSASSYDGVHLKGQKVPTIRLLTRYPQFSLGSLITGIMSPAEYFVLMPIQLNQYFLYMRMNYPA